MSQCDGKKSAHSVFRLTFSGLVRALTMVCLIAAGASIAAFFGRMNWLLSLFSQFRLAYVYLFVAMLLLCWWYRRWWLAGTYAVFLAINGAVVYYDCIAPAHSATVSGGVPLRVLQTNIWDMNRDFHRLATYMRDSGAAVIGIEEYSREADSAFTKEGLWKEFPYRVAKPSCDRSPEIALLSRYPLSNVRPVVTSAEHDLSLIADCTIGDRKFTVVVAHPRPPVGAHLYKRSCLEFRTIASLRPTMLPETILLGDLNTTQFSWQFDDFIKRMGLLDARRGHGPSPTWMTWLPVLPIDAILVSPDIQVRHFEIAAPTGSDHRPLMADLELP